MSKHLARNVRLHLFTKLRPGPVAVINRQTATRASHSASNDLKGRLSQLERYGSKEQWYPRLSDSPRELSVRNFIKQYTNVDKGETRQEEARVSGRIRSIRSAGSKLAFVTIQHDQKDMQIVLRHAKIAPSLDVKEISSFGSFARVGDSFSFSGLPHRTERGQLSILATEQPMLLAPSLHQIPEQLSDPDTLAHKRHVHMLVDPSLQHTLRVRHAVEQGIDQFLTSQNFIKVVTPMLQAGAGGAIARPFETRATEFPEKNLHLRIAPELWLKRLILGGMDRVFEIGTVFRNEGIDATHNPEFTICEFYASHATLDQLMKWTETLMRQLATATKTNLALFELPFRRLEFLPTIEERLGQRLPDLQAVDARTELEAIFKQKSVPVPAKPSLPRLLDSLAALYIEPQCDSPTFILNHPACMSPLSKHFECPKTKQQIAARAELFVQGREIANMYEEQNSPFAQKAAFLEQLKHRDIDGEHDPASSGIDNAYLEALEWGLPPTGGWGCGVDRLVMLFSGKKKIADVLAFGTLQNVVGSAS